MKEHWYLFVFKKGGVSESLIIGYPEKDLISLKRIEMVREETESCKKPSLLANVSYLGYMTKDEFELGV